jgi:hypothetical protein
MLQNINHALLRLALVVGVTAGLALCGAARAQTFDPSDNTGWFLRLGAVARFNVKANVESITPTKPPGVYDNGFVLPDSGGGGQTWNWGFNDDSQSGAGQLVLDRLDDVPSIGKQDVDVPNPLLGGEIIGGFRFSDLEIGKTKGRFGFEVGFGYSGFSENVNAIVTGTARSTTDSFGLGGIVPPLAPYSGTAAGPGPLISLNPGARTMVVDTPGGTTTDFDGSLEANFYAFRIGPTFEIDLTRRLSLAVGLGYTSVYTDCRLQYDEAVRFTAPGLTGFSHHATINDGDWRVGFYTELRVNYRLFQHLDLFGGFDFQHNSKFTFGDSRYEATVDLGATFGGKAGLTIWF